VGGHDVADFVFLLVAHFSLDLIERRGRRQRSRRRPRGTTSPYLHARPGTLSGLVLDQGEFL
jgi:hypothetical protein